MTHDGNMQPAGRCNPQKFYLYFLLLIGTFCVTYPTKAWTEWPSFSEWHDTMEKAFKDFQRQEDKLLDANTAKTLTWEKGLRTAWKPEDSVLEAERKRDAKAVAALEACRRALSFGSILRLKALDLLAPGRDNPLNIDGDIPFDQYARLYIGFAETCEEGLGLPRPANAFRTRYP
jgi:hypothetical protein